MFYHFGDTDIHLKVARVNSYSTGLVQDKLGKQGTCVIRCTHRFFFRSFILKRNCLNGWAGFITSVTGRLRVLKYISYGYRQFERYGVSLFTGGTGLPRCWTKA